MRSNYNLYYRLTSGIAAVILLTIGLMVTSYALVLSTISVKENTFMTGDVSIDLNGGKSILGRETDDEFIKNLLMEPGATIIRNFYIKNNSSCDVYYRIYMEDISGDLSDILELTIREGNAILFCGHPSALTRQAFTTSTLRQGETKNLTAEFYYPEYADNRGQGKELNFTLCAEATQVPNNSNQQFE